MQRNTSDSVTREVVLALCDRINTPKSLAVSILLRSNEDKTLLEQISCDPSDYCKWDDFAVDYGITSILSKWIGLRTGVDLKRTAFEKWKTSEDQCKVTNTRFRAGQRYSDHSEVAAIMYMAQQKIASVLASGWRHKTPFTSVLLRCLDAGRWGPGSTADIRRASGLDTKISKKPTVSHTALPYGRFVLGQDPVWFESVTGIVPDGPCSAMDNCFSLRESSRWLTVPKNSKTDRCIAAEPTMNGFIQAGIGSYIRQCLENFGVRLDDQSLNKEMAQRALSENLATLDLSAASDTISRELIRSLLPLDWFCFLDDVRTKSTRVDGRDLRLEKFSSMGNGFTFELETLVFWALSKSTLELKEHRDILAVYGDDIIVPTEAAALVTQVLEHCGFTINQDKSFTEGLFYESCGGHYFDGRDVTPVYQKRLVTSLAESIRFANRLVRWSERLNGHWRSSIIKSAHQRLIEYGTQCCGRSKLPAIPIGTEGDDGFLFPESYFKGHSVSKQYGIRCRVLQYREGKTRARDLPLYAYKLRRPFMTYASSKRNVFKPSGHGEFVFRERYVNVHDLHEHSSRYSEFKQLIIERE